MASLADGEIIDKYEVLELLGSGGMATVYRVRHSGLGSEHALKVLDPVLTRDPEIRQRFIDEGRIQASLKHPGIVAVTDIVAQPGVAGLVAEFVEGPDLDQWIEQHGGTSDPSTIQGLFLPILDALGYAHTQGVIHRDIKPSNIIVGRSHDGTVQPKLLDFGIAKVLEGGPSTRKRATKTGARLGTIHYMSPEQIRGASDLDARTDLFALAVTLYEFVTGEVPYDAGTDYDTMKQIVEGHPVPIRDRVADIDPVLEECCARGMAPKRADRFGSGKEFSELLRRLGQTPSAVPIAPEGRRSAPSSQSENAGPELSGSPSRADSTPARPMSSSDRVRDPGKARTSGPAEGQAPTVCPHCGAGSGELVFPRGYVGAHCGACGRWANATSKRPAPAVPATQHASSEGEGEIGPVGLFVVIMFLVLLALALSQC